MLSKKEILSTGTIVKFSYKDNGDDILAVIVGHLTISKKMKCHYDYICVQFPFGIEHGLLYINHPDIIEVVYEFTGCPSLRSMWIDRKYGDYLAYYKYYRADLRPDINEINIQNDNAKQLLNYYYSMIMMLICIICFIFGLGIGVTAIVTNQWLAVPGAVLFIVVSIYIIKKRK